MLQLLEADKGSGQGLAPSSCPPALSRLLDSGCALRRELEMGPPSGEDDGAWMTMSPNRFLPQAIRAWPHQLFEISILAVSRCGTRCEKMTSWHWPIDKFRVHPQLLAGGVLSVSFCRCPCLLTLLGYIALGCRTLGVG